MMKYDEMGTALAFRLFFASSAEHPPNERGLCSSLKCASNSRLTLGEARIRFAEPIVTGYATAEVLESFEDALACLFVGSKADRATLRDRRELNSLIDRSASALGLGRDAPPMPLRANDAATWRRMQAQFAELSAGVSELKDLVNGCVSAALLTTAAMNALGAPEMPPHTWVDYAAASRCTDCRVKVKQWCSACDACFRCNTKTPSMCESCVVDPAAYL